MKSSLTVTCSVLILLVFAPAASAQATRTWVSGLGDDLNPCSRTAPCKTFAGAISKTTAGGEIDVLDPGGFGAVTITKSLTIDGGYSLAGIAANGVTGVIVNAAGIVVTLRRLSINGFGSGVSGVSVVAAGLVSIEDSQISGFTNGVNVAAASNAKVQITNVQIENNSNAGVLVASGNTTITGCALVGNGYAGLDANGASPVVLASNSNVSMNGRGIHTGGGGIVRMTHLDIFFNTVFAWEIGGGQIQTHVDNRIMGAGSGALTPMVF